MRQSEARKADRAALPSAAIPFAKCGPGAPRTRRAESKCRFCAPPFRRHWGTARAPSYAFSPAHPCRYSSAWLAADCGGPQPTPHGQTALFFVSHRYDLSPSVCCTNAKMSPSIPLGPVSTVRQKCANPWPSHTYVRRTSSARPPRILQQCSFPTNTSSDIDAHTREHLSMGIAVW